MRFHVDAAGTSPLSYQWRFNGVELAGGTNATLVLTNVQPAMAGDYDVLISSLAGSTRSQSARLSFIRSVEQSWAARFHPNDETGSWASRLTIDTKGNAYVIGRAADSSGWVISRSSMTTRERSMGSTVWARLRVSESLRVCR
jgi:hypothetical protein